LKPPPLDQVRSMNPLLPAPAVGPRGRSGQSVRPVAQRPQGDRAARASSRIELETGRTRGRAPGESCRRGRGFQWPSPFTPQQADARISAGRSTAPQGDRALQSTIRCPVGRPRPRPAPPTPARWAWRFMQAVTMLVDLGHGPRFTPVGSESCKHPASVRPVVWAAAPASRLG